MLIKWSCQKLVESKNDVIELGLRVWAGKLGAGLLRLLGLSRRAGWGSRTASGTGLMLYQFLALGVWLMLLLLRGSRAVARSGRSRSRGSRSSVESGELAKRTRRVTQGWSVAVVVAVRRSTAP